MYMLKMTNVLCLMIILMYIGCFDDSRGASHFKQNRVVGIRRTLSNAWT